MSGRHNGRIEGAHLAVLVIVMAAAEEELERLLVPEDGGPSEGCIPLVVWIGIAHVSPLDETFDEEEIVLWAGHTSVRVGVLPGSGCDAPVTALRRRAEASFSAMAVKRRRTGRGRGRGTAGAYKTESAESKHSPSGQ